MGCLSDLWLLRPDQLEPEQVSMAAALMSSDEKMRQTRLRYPNQRRTFTVTRGLVRQILSQYADVEAAAWRFEPGEYGKPRVAWPAGDLRFSVSHTSSVIAVLVTVGAEGGVDVERIDRPFEVGPIARRFFSSQECESLLALEPSLRPRRFFQIWTAKEAYLKARGFGRLLPLDGFSISFDAGERPSISFHGIDDDPALWQLEHLAVGDDHAATVAIRGGVSAGRSLRLFDAAALWVAPAAAASA